MIAFLLILVTLLCGVIAAGIVMRPSAVASKKDVIEFNLTDIAPVWTQFNKEFVPLTAAETKQEANIEGIWDKQLADDTEKQPAVVPDPAGPSPVSGLYIASPPPPAAAASPPAPPSLPVAEIPAGTGLNLAELAEPLKSLWDDCIIPYRSVISSQGANKTIMAILRLIEEHGHCSSVLIDGNDSESVDLNSVRDTLAKVKLRDHTYSVCRYLVGSLKDTYKDYINMVPAALVMSLAHDIGKIPEIRLTGTYNSRDHALVSGDKLAEIIGGGDALWSRKAIKAVREHHLKSADDTTVLLKRADRQARQAELVTITRNFSIKTFAEWFDIKKYLTSYIAPLVNVTQVNKWNAFSFRGVIYAQPDFIYEQARKMCHDEKALDLSFVYESEKENVQRMVVSALRKADMAPFMGDNFTGRKFDIKTKMAVKNMRPSYYLTAITIPEYINTIEMESRKTGFAEIIETVVPIG